MAKEIDSKKMDKVVALIKKEGVGTLSETQVCEQTGIEKSESLRYIVQAELKADPSLKIPATGKAVVKARNSGLRWPRIAARAGISESRAKELYSEESGEDAAASYTGRGRKFSGTGTAPAKSAASGRRSGSKTKAAPAATSGRRGRGAAAKKTAAAPTARGRRGTRSGAKTAADPK